MKKLTIRSGMKWRKFKKAIGKARNDFSCKTPPRVTWRERRMLVSFWSRNPKMQPTLHGHPMTWDPSGKPIMIMRFSYKLKESQPTVN